MTIGVLIKDAIRGTRAEAAAPEIPCVILGRKDFQAMRELAEELGLATTPRIIRYRGIEFACNVNLPEVEDLPGPRGSLEDDEFSCPMELTGSNDESAATARALRKLDMDARR